MNTLRSLSSPDLPLAMYSEKRRRTRTKKRVRGFLQNVALAGLFAVAVAMGAVASAKRNGATSCASCTVTEKAKR